LEGFRGQSDLVVSFWANSKMLVSPNLEVALSLRFTPLVVSQYSRKLGASLGLFKTRVSNKEHVLVLRERPMGLSQTQQVSRFTVSPAPPAAHGIRHQIVVADEGIQSRFQSTIAQLEIESEPERAVLLAGAEVKTVQIGPCSMRVSVGNATHIVRYPYPIRGVETVTRVDKKLFHVQVCVLSSRPILRS
jgi:hypothetical protein